MKVLLDTRAFLWWTSGSSRLSARVGEIVGDPRSEVHVSVATAWEIAIKASAGRLELEVPADRYVPDRMRRHGFIALPIEIDHALRAGSLPRHHGDPFDRLIVAQSQIEDMPIITADPVLGLYDVETIW